MNTNEINIIKKTWASPQMIKIAASQIKGAAVALDADEDFVNPQLQVTSSPKKVMHVVAVDKAAPHISLGRFAFYCVLMVIMLPLFLLTGRGASR